VRGKRTRAKRRERNRTRHSRVISAVRSREERTTTTAARPPRPRSPRKREKGMRRASGRKSSFGTMELFANLGIDRDGEGEDEDEGEGEGEDDKTIEVSITYKTSSIPSECTAAQWLPPSQTSGKVRPYLFTQCQAVHARSIVPCMDCPGVKFTYDAEVTVPGWAVAVMSALPKEEKTREGKVEDGPAAAAGEEGKKKVFEFEQPVPIPSYLLALAVGDLSSRDLSPRCRVYSEPSVVGAAAHEFAQTEDFLRAAEDLTGVPYPWGRYDLLCLPPSFPYGGMENPCLTFVTPTLLAGDRSLADVVAHEISHSWTGNLVTNRTWEHFWLNEGWTVWLQRRIMIHPLITEADANPEGVYGLDASGGWKDLADDVALHEPDDTKLVLDLSDGSDPDDAYSSVPYEKGFNLLRALELRVGSDAFLNFAQAYIAKFQYGTATSEEFRSFFGEYFADKKEGAKAKDFDWDTWLYGNGMPPSDYDPQFDKSLAEASESLAESWLKYDAAKGFYIPEGDLSGWSTAQRTWFLDVLMTGIEERGAKPLKFATIKSMGEKYGFASTKNAEVLFRYLMLAVPSADMASEEGREILTTAARFITTQGRMKYVRPLYRAMRDAGEETRALARTTFLANREFYHPIAAKMVAGDLAADEGEDEEGEARDSTSPTTSSTGKRLIIMAALVGLALVGMAVVRSRKR